MNEKDPVNVLTGCAFACILILCITAVVVTAMIRMG